MEFTIIQLEINKKEIFIKLPECTLEELRKKGDLKKFVFFYFNNNYFLQLKSI